MSEVEYYSEGKISWITINRPEKKNSINDKVMEGLENAVSTALGEKSAVLIFQGNGNFFSAGADINMFFNMDEDTARAFSNRGNNLMDRIDNYPGITISAIEGGALGGGLELALSTDIRIASRDSKLGLPEITLGIFPGWGGIKRIIRSVGNSSGRYMLLTGKYITGEDAHKLGLVQMISENPKNDAINLANELKERSVESITMIKGLLNQSIYSTELEGQYFGKIITSESSKRYLEKFKKR